MPFKYFIFVVVVVVLCGIKDINADIDFEPHCSRSTYGSSPESRTTVLPRPLPATRGPSQETIQDWYDKGIKECKEYLQVVSKLNHTQVAEERDNSFFYKLTGLLLWSFGPVSQCPTHSKCWFGIMTCGNFQAQRVVDFYKERRVWKLPKAKPVPVMPHRMPDFDQWSMKALHIHTHIKDIESFVPEMFYTSFVHSVSGSVVDVQIAEYTLTIPGFYHIEAWLLGFYMGKLFKFTESEVNRGVEDLLHIPFSSVRFVTPITYCEDCKTCLNPYFECCKCLSQTFLVNAPFPMTSTYGGHKCGKNGHIPVTNLSLAHKQLKNLDQSMLPLCKRGDHVGRYLIIPDEVTKRCKVQAVLEKIEQSGGGFEDNGNVMAKFMKYHWTSESFDGDLIWAPVTEGIRDESLPLETRLHYAELNRCVSASCLAAVLCTREGAVCCLWGCS
jgi:hypothetical protein